MGACGPAADAMTDAPVCGLCAKPMAMAASGLYDNRLGTAGSYAFYECPECRLGQLWPRPDEASISEIYEKHYNSADSRAGRYSRIRAAVYASPLYRFWMAIDGDPAFHSLAGKGRLLDVGCNEGRSLAILAGNGFEAEGIEVNPKAAAVAVDSGFNVHVGSLESFQAPGRFDVAVLANVLEHMAEPSAALRHIRGLLAPGGRLFVSCPNGESWQRRLFGRNWVNWHVPFHLHFFSRSSLKRLLQDAGFKVVRIGNITPALWSAQSAIVLFFSRPGKVTRQLRNSGLLIFLMLAIRFLLFPLSWIANRTGHGDCLVAEARKEA